MYGLGESSQTVSLSDFRLRPCQVWSLESHQYVTNAFLGTEVKYHMSHYLSIDPVVAELCCKPS